MALRKALLVGINDYREAPLRGSINDVKQMKHLLQTVYGFPKDGIRVLIDKEATHAGIRTGLQWLAVGGDEPDAVRVFHFAGHGSYVADRNGDEPDGRDECLAPYDYESMGMLTDDVLSGLYDRIPASSNLTLVMDSCHSGTVQRAAGKAFRFIPMSIEERERADAAAAKFAQDQQDYVTEKMRQLRGQGMTGSETRAKARELARAFEKVRFGGAREANVLLAACRSDQQSAEARFGDEYRGAFTYYLCQAIEETEGQITYGQLVKLADLNLDDHGFEQVPQLETHGSRDKRLAFQPFD